MLSLSLVVLSSTTTSFSPTVSSISSGVGISVVPITGFIVIYYNVVVAYCIFYFFRCWNHCCPYHWVYCHLLQCRFRLLYLLFLQVLASVLSLSLGLLSSTTMSFSPTVSFISSGVGISVVLITGCIVIYYNVVFAYCIFYFFRCWNKCCPNHWVYCHLLQRRCRLLYILFLQVLASVLSLSLVVLSSTTTSLSPTASFISSPP